MEGAARYDDDEGRHGQPPLLPHPGAVVRYVSRDEWELLKRHTADHLRDSGWPHRPAREPEPTAASPAPQPQTRQYFSGNYPGKISD
jgi:hypothetical protein